MIHELDASTFDNAISTNESIVVDFYATWCGPCVQVTRALEQIDETGQIGPIAKLDIDQAPHIAQRYGILSVPTIIRFENGQPARTHIGAAHRTVITAAVGPQQ